LIVPQAHIKKKHKNEKFIPPKSPNIQIYEKFENQDETIEPILDETTGLLLSTRKRKKYPRKTGRFECGKCSWNVL
jgi:hypothetical protein